MQYGWGSSLLLGLLESEISLVEESELDSSGGEKGDDGLLAFTDDEHVVGTGSEGVTIGILNVGNIEGRGVLLDVLEDTDSADVVTTDDQNEGTVLILDE